MSKPNMHCGECPYWLAFGEPETTDEQNEAILAHCKECGELEELVESVIAPSPEEVGEDLKNGVSICERLLIISNRREYNGT
jgi:hypothetical protein